MATPELAVQAALFDLLDGNVGAGVGVWEHPPADQPPPLVVVGESTIAPAGGKDGGLDRVEFVVSTWWSGGGRKAGLDIMDAVRALVEGAALTDADWLLSPPVFDGAETSRLDDGDWFVGRQRFFLFAQPA